MIHTNLFENHEPEVHLVEPPNIDGIFDMNTYK